MKLSAEDLCLLRGAHLLIQGKALEAEAAQHALQCLLLKLERKYGLVGTQATLDISTGHIAQEASDEPQRHAVPGAEGPAR